MPRHLVVSSTDRTRAPGIRADRDRLAWARPGGLLLVATLASACGDDTSDGGSGGAAAEGAGGGGAASSTGAAGGDGQGGGASTGATGSGGSAANGAGGGAAGPVIVGGDRPAEVFVPSSYVDGAPMPLVVLLHGYGVSASLEELYLKVEPLAEELGFLYVRPDGTFDDSGKRFWNATDACCNFYGAAVDDSAYLRGVIDEVKERLAVDPARVFFVGHSNGGFMSYRMACDHADTIAAVASLAGATFDDVAACAPAEPVAALQIHGTDDTTILFEGGDFPGAPYPGATTTAATWAAYGGCDGAPIAGSPRDLEGVLAGDESTTQAWSAGCEPGGGAELWSIEGGGHIPTPSATFTRQVVEWLLAHPKP